MASRGAHHTPEAFDHQVFGQPMLNDPVRGDGKTPKLAEVSDSPSLLIQRTISFSHNEWEGNRREKRLTAPVVRRMFSGFGVYFFVNVPFWSRKKTNKFGMRTLNCPFIFAALFPFGKSRISPTAQIEGCDSNCSVGRTLTNPSDDSEFWPRASDIQAVFGLGPYVGTYKK